MRHLDRLRPNSLIQEWMYLSTGFAIVLVTWRYVIVESRRNDWIPMEDIYVMSLCGVMPFTLLFWYSALWCLKVLRKFDW